MVSVIKDEEITMLQSHLATIEHLNLDINWILALSSLCAQEIAVKKKLDMLGEDYSDSDFQKLAINLKKAYATKNLDPPKILISIIQSYRHIRGELLHTHHKNKMDIAETEAIIKNTEALITTLFTKIENEVDISDFIEEINSETLNQKEKEFTDFTVTMKINIFEKIFDLLHNFTDSSKDGRHILLDFLASSIKLETDSVTQNSLIEIIIKNAVLCRNEDYFSDLMDIIRDMSQISSIRKFIVKENYLNSLIAFYEMSNNWGEAGKMAYILYNFVNQLTQEEIERIMESSLDNSQIRYSYSAKNALKEIIRIRRNDIPKEKLEMYLKTQNND